MPDLLQALLAAQAWIVGLGGFGGSMRGQSLQLGLMWPSLGVVRVLFDQRAQDILRLTAIAACNRGMSGMVQSLANALTHLQGKAVGLVEPVDNQVGVVERAVFKRNREVALVKGVPG